MVYVKGGYSRTRLTASYEDRAGGIDLISEEEDLEGFHVGGGLELGLGRRAYGRLDYTYSDYQDGRLDFDGVSARSDMTRHQVLLGFGLRF
jgi:outer membrane immunogenic protein